MRTAQKKLILPLTVGFGTLLFLIVAATVVTLTRGFAIFELLEKTHERHYQAAEALQNLRSDLYLAGILKRDFLLDQGRATGYGEQFAEIQASADKSLNIIEKTLGREQPESVRQLRSEVSAHLRPLKEALDWEPVLAPGLRSYLLRAQLTQRTAALQMASEIERLNKDSLLAQQTRISEAEDEFRQTLLLISLASVILGATVACFTILYTHRLERQSEEVRVELRTLSRHVVKAQEHERRSISRELHDEVGQMLTGLRMELANLDVPAIQQNPSDYQRLQEAKRLTERTLQCVRNLSLLLRPSMLDDLGLSPALNWQAKEFSRRSGIPVDVSIEGEVDTVPDDVRTCVYRVVQEALTNVARHAGAKSIRLLVKRQGDHVNVAIEDDGAGFQVTGKPRQGIGLIGLKERVSELSGTLQILSQPGKGTRIAVEIPLVAQAMGQAAC